LREASAAQKKEKRKSRKEGGESSREESSVPPFSDRWFISFPTGVSSYEESIEEEVRWTKFLEKRADTVDDKARKYIQEYIQVGCPSMDRVRCG
jgi:hypothetical protein